MANYQTNSEGKFIPASQRPDGTWRKARRVKTGYVPQEEVPLYESKGKQFAQRKTTLSVGMCPLMDAAAKKEREKREKRSKKRATKKWVANIPGVLVLPKKDEEADEVTKDVTANADAAPTIPKASSSNDDEMMQTIANGMTALNIQSGRPNQQRQSLRTLRKKLRKIEQLEAKINSGELKHPDVQELSTVASKAMVLCKIEILKEEQGLNKCN